MTQRPTAFSRRAAVLGLLLVLAAITDLSSALAEPFHRDGIRFEVLMTIRLDEIDHVVLGRGLLDVTARIASHTNESTFSGDIVERFGAVDLEAGAPLRLLWSDPQCHQDRGLPRLAVRRVTGTLDVGSATRTVDAVPRTIGKLVPEDEIYLDARNASENVELGSEPGNSIRSLMFRTRLSHFLIVLRLSRIKCSYS